MTYSASKRAPHPRINVRIWAWNSVRSAECGAGATVFPRHAVYKFVAGTTASSCKLKKIEATNGL